MLIDLEWGRPVRLRSGARKGLIYDVDLDEFEPEPGIYVFARTRGRNTEALYVGQSANVRRRVRRHLNNLRLMRHLQTAKTGRRVVIPAYPITRGGQRIASVLDVLERALIRHFLADGHDLVNKQGTRIRRHEIASTGPVAESFVPALVYLERERRR